MNVGKTGGSQFYDRRGLSRAVIAVPVHLGRGAIGAAEGVSAAEGQSTNLSTSGVYLSTHARGPFDPGDLLRVSIEIPQDARRLFPFSRIVGLCRVVRVDQLADSKEAWPRVGLALEFSRRNITLLGAIIA